MNLYEIKKEYLDILSNPAYVDMETGEITEAGEKALNENQENLTTKLDNIARFIRSLEAESDMYKKESDRLLALKKSADSKAKSLKKYVDSALNGQNLDTDLFKFSYRKSEKAEILEKEKLPEQFVTIEQVERIAGLPDIKKFLKSEIEARVAELKADGKEFDENDIKTDVYSQYGLNITFNQNLQIK